MEQRCNRLGAEKSPYLLQHAGNPVDWYPWGAEAFARAKQENKPIFLSIGYSTCHWCHVMAHESFENEQVAALLNESFVCVKVDREERPDIDGIYMQVCQMMTGSGGWPLTVIMTPDREPFFAGTYFPKETLFGHIGMLELIPKITEQWEKQQQQVVMVAHQMTRALQKAAQTVGGPELGEETLNQAYQQLAERYDTHHGGFGGAPKFPSPNNLFFMLRYWNRHRKNETLAMVENTLQSMRRGGIYDHIGFGFHRYSTDHKWLVPHFEKMLYDQALLAMVYAEAYQATGRERYGQTAREILRYVLRDMTAPEGGFYSGEDADSEGVEGKFYQWSREEIQESLRPEEAELFMKVFNIEPEGNYNDDTGGHKTGTNILHITHLLAELGKEHHLAKPQLQEQLEKIREKLFGIREKRIHPYKDDKILTDWNGLMIAALAKAGQVLEEPKYIAAARQAADFIFANLLDDGGRLLHRWREGQAEIAGHMDDYAFVIWGLLELYEADFDVRHLERALQLNKEFLKHFWDEANGGFFMTADDSEELLVRQKEIYDGAKPSGNSVAMLNLLRLGRITGQPRLEEKAEAISRAFSHDVRHMPIGYTQLMLGVDFAVGPSYEVVIVGRRDGEDTRAMLRAIRSRYLPNQVVLLREAGEPEPGITKVAPFTRNLTSQENRATAYVCRDYRCESPTTEVDRLIELLDQSM